MTFDLDLWPTDLNINRDHLLIKDYLPTKFEASGAKRSWVISCTRWSRLAWPLTLTFDLLTWISIGVIYSSRTIYLPSLKLLGQRVLELSVAQGKGDWRTDWPTDMCNAICPPFSKGGMNIIYKSTINKYMYHNNFEDKQNTHHTYCNKTIYLFSFLAHYAQFLCSKIIFFLGSWNVTWCYFQFCFFFFNVST